MIKYRFNVLEVLKEHGYSQFRLQREGILSGTQIQRLSKGEFISLNTLDKICRICHMQPGDILEFMDDEQESL